jgi:thiol-disulfide isomerase/thioredoxin
VSAAPAPFAPYRTGDWKALLRVHAGAPFIVHFWGVTCGPCIVELPKWSEFTKRHPAVPIVFVEVDPAPEPVARRILAQAHLDAADNRLLASPFDEYMRYEVDRKWVGELPATLLVDRNGQARRLSGAGSASAGVAPGGGQCRRLCLAKPPSPTHEDHPRQHLRRRPGPGTRLLYIRARFPEEA